MCSRPPPPAVGSSSTWQPCAANWSRMPGMPTSAQMQTAIFTPSTSNSVRSAGPVTKPQPFFRLVQQVFALDDEPPVRHRDETADVDATIDTFERPGGDRDLQLGRHLFQACRHRTIGRRRRGQDGWSRHVPGDGTLGKQTQSRTGLRSLLGQLMDLPQVAVDVAGPANDLSGREVNRLRQAGRCLVRSVRLRLDTRQVEQQWPDGQKRDTTQIQTTFDHGSSPTRARACVAWSAGYRDSKAANHWRYRPCRAKSGS